jgi:hypothetical protein
MASRVVRVRVHVRPRWRWRVLLWARRSYLRLTPRGRRRLALEREHATALERRLFFGEG